MDLLDQKKKSEAGEEMLYMIKKYAHLWNVGTKVDILHRSHCITIKQLDEVNTTQLKMTRTRLEGLTAL